MFCIAQDNLSREACDNGDDFGLSADVLLVNEWKRACVGEASREKEVGCDNASVEDVVDGEEQDALVGHVDEPLAGHLHVAHVHDDPRHHEPGQHQPVGHVAGGGGGGRGPLAGVEQPHVRVVQRELLPVQPAAAHPAAALSLSQYRVVQYEDDPSVSCEVSQSPYLAHRGSTQLINEVQVSGPQLFVLCL